MVIPRGCFYFMPPTSSALPPTSSAQLFVCWNKSQNNTREKNFMMNYFLHASEFHAPLHVCKHVSRHSKERALNQGMLCLLLMPTGELWLKEQLLVSVWQSCSWLCCCILGLYARPQCSRVVLASLLSRVSYPTMWSGFKVIGPLFTPGLLSDERLN